MIVDICMFSPDGRKKAYVRLTADHDALDVANKVNSLLMWLGCISYICPLDWFHLSAPSSSASPFAPSAVSFVGVPFLFSIIPVTGGPRPRHVSFRNATQLLCFGSLMCLICITLYMHMVLRNFAVAIANLPVSDCHPGFQVSPIIAY